MIDYTGVSLALDKIYGGSRKFSFVVDEEDPQVRCLAFSKQLPAGGCLCRRHRSRFSHAWVELLAKAVGLWVCHALMLLWAASMRRALLCSSDPVT